MMYACRISQLLKVIAYINVITGLTTLYYNITFTTISAKAIPFKLL